MKKLRTLLLMLLLAALSANAALGEGLNGLADLAETPAPTQAPAEEESDAGGLSGLYGLMPVPSEEPEAGADPSRGILPDPQDLLGTASSTMEDYAFSEDYRCSVYYYPLPADDNAFLLDYTEKARERGFSVEKTVLEGYDAWKFVYGDLYAMLVPQYMGVTLLLTENGMRMGDPLPEGTYLRVRRNGVLNEKTDLDAVNYVFSSSKYEGNVSRLIEIDFTKDVTAASEYAKLDLYSLTLNLPDPKEGAQYEFNLDFSPESAVALSTDKDGDLYHVYHAAESVYNPYNFFDYTIVEKHNTAFKDEQDFFRLNITSVTKNETGQIWNIEGTFEGRFKGGALNYTDGSFRVMYIP